ncbi:MAG: hypothetical protein HRT90_09785 [Candidatus Margulisbacteria bacterium]|nr:hypothetical protein [Candidatus Margulisiibacteriota bacterium]
MADIMHTLTIEAKPAEIYEKIATKQGLSSWWTADTLFEPILKSVAEFGFANRAVVFKMRIDILDQDKRTQWECVDGPVEWLYTKFFFDIEPKEDGHCYLHFKQTGWKEANRLYAICNFDWAFYLLNLKDVIENPPDKDNGS